MRGSGNTDFTIWNSASGIAGQHTYISNSWKMVVHANGVNVAGGLSPDVDSSRNCGSNGVRWLNGYFDKINGAVPDLEMTDTHCYICDRRFKKNDKLMFIVKDDDVKYRENDPIEKIATVPICLDCGLEEEHITRKEAA